jgi:hypothetical protein
MFAIPKVAGLHFPHTSFSELKELRVGSLFFFIIDHLANEVSASSRKTVKVKIKLMRSDLLITAYTKLS